ncbi:MAG: cytochrome P450 [Thermoleophilia bacterium]|nr:cytochrome P450 [Thermoleophilia bacterium]
MTAGELTLDDIDLGNDVFAERVPHEMFALLRKEAPVHWYDWQGGEGFWCVTKHADLVAVHRDTETFSSETGATALEDLDEDQIAARKSMLDMDPPGHSRLRGLVSELFTPRTVRTYEATLRELTRVVVERALALGEFDFVEEIARELPIRVLARLLGVPDEDTGKLIVWGDGCIGNTDPELTDVLHESPESEKYRLVPFRSPTALDIFDYGHWLADQRRHDARDDLVSKLVHAEIDGQKLSSQEFDTMFLLLVVAGNETTRQAIAHGMNTLIEHRDEWRRLQDSPELLRQTGADEILRWTTPVLHFRRTATRDVELRGTSIRAGEKVVVWYISANFDEEVFDDPTHFDVGRSPNRQVAFGGGGPHYCLGAHLAKLEVQVMFEELLPRMSDMELTGPVERLRSNFTNGFKRMPVRITTS